MRLAPFTGVYGLSFVFALMAAALALAVLRRPRVELLWLAPLLLLVAAAATAAARNAGAKRRCWCSRTSRRPSSGPRRVVDAMKRRQVMLSLRGALSEPGQPPSIIVWPEVPAPLYYFDDPVFRGMVDNLARAANAYVLLGIVAHTPRGAPLNSAVLVSPEGAPRQPLRQDEPGAVRRVRAVAVRVRQ